MYGSIGGDMTKTYEALCKEKDALSEIRRELMNKLENTRNLQEKIDA